MAHSARLPMPCNSSLTLTRSLRLRPHTSRVHGHIPGRSRISRHYHPGNRNVLTGGWGGGGGGGGGGDVGRMLLQVDLAVPPLQLVKSTGTEFTICTLTLSDNKHVVPSFTHASRSLMFAMPCMGHPFEVLAKILNPILEPCNRRVERVVCP